LHKSGFKNKIDEMKYIFSLLFLVLGTALFAQGPPAKKQVGTFSIMGGTLHVGNGTVIENSFIAIQDGKIMYAGPLSGAPSLPEGKNINAKGKSIYPGLVALNTQLGLVEIGAVRATRDRDEIGDFNPSIRSVIAYNTESMVIPTVRTNGILTAQIVPEGNVMPGQSSMVQLDAWNWEDAVVAADNVLHINWPRAYRRTGSWPDFGPIKPNDKYPTQIAKIEDFLAQAKAYKEQTNPKETNLKFEVLKEVYAGKKKIFVYTNDAKSMMHATNLIKSYKLEPVIVGGAESHLILEFLKENGVSVVLDQLHRLPRRDENDVDLPYKLPSMLSEAGIPFALSMPGFWEVRNLPFQAGQAVGHGLPYEKAIEAITLSPARIAGISYFTGSLEKNKDGTLIICEGDVLDMRTSKITHAFIQGREVDLDNKQTALYRKFMGKYEGK